MINVDHLKEWHRIFSASARRSTTAALGSFGERVAMSNRHRKDLRFTPRTGRLNNATTSKTRGTRDGAELTLTNATPYACPIEFGAIRHTIKAKNKPLLVFFWTRLGKWFSAKKVNHPGNQPYKFLLRAIIAQQWDLSSRLIERLTSIAKGF